MIEIMQPEDIKKIPSVEIQNYLEMRFEQLHTPFDPSKDGYFLYLEDPALLNQALPLRYGLVPSIKQGLFKRVEGVEITPNVVEIFVLFNNEFLLSIILSRGQCSNDFLQKVSNGGVHEKA